MNRTIDVELAPSRGARRNAGRLSISLIAIASIAGFSTHAYGAIYAGDVIIIIGCIGLLFGGRWLTWRPLELGVVALLSFCALCFLLFDLYNKVPASAYMRGFSRNLIFCGAVVLGIDLIKRAGVRVFVTIVTVWALSVGVLILFGVAEDWNGWDRNIITFSKFNFGVFGFPALVLMAGRRKGVAVAAGTLAVIILATWADYRSGAVLAGASLFLTLVWSRMQHVQVIKMTVLSLLAIIVIVVAAVSTLSSKALFSEDILERRGDSNRQRLDMAVFTVKEFLQRPVTGYGSWQNIERYVDPERPHARISVHSAILQYMYEYGVLGLVYPGTILLFAVWSLADLVRITRVEPFGVSAGAVFIYLIGIYNCFMGGISGYGRFIYAASLALCIAIASGGLRKRETRTRRIAA